uniref:ATPase subunit 8 n=1 Tax=Metacanthus pulchellus TaxID=2813417 RepID=A0A8T9ZX06_9HEMI|nr:ATPase subunit 8 [Metacanthus pulchellus]
MPQMAPLWWELLFATFMMLYMFMNILIFWLNSTSFNNTKIKKKSYKNINWKF